MHSIRFGDEFCNDGDADGSCGEGGDGDRDGDCYGGGDAGTGDGDEVIGVGGPGRSVWERVGGYGVLLVVRTTAGVRTVIIKYSCEFTH